MLQNKCFAITSIFFLLTHCLLKVNAFITQANTCGLRVCIIAFFTVEAPIRVCLSAAQKTIIECPC